MAIYHLSVKTISRSAGRSATAAAAYRSGVKIEDEHTGEIHDYTRKGGVESATLVLPAGTPKWASDRAKLWNKAEAAETRKNSTVAREFEIALPSELNRLQRKALAVEFARHLVAEYGFAADVAIHAPGKEGDNRNHHAHILVTTRRLTSEGFTEKTRELDDRKTGPAHVKQWREYFAIIQNRHLADAGHDVRVDHRTLEAQGIDRAPTMHLGPAATAIERRTGQPSKVRQDHTDAGVAALVEKARLGKQIDKASVGIADLEQQLNNAKAEQAQKAIKTDPQRKPEVEELPPDQQIAVWDKTIEMAVKGQQKRIQRITDKAHARYNRRDEKSRKARHGEPQAPKGLFGMFKEKSYQAELNVWSRRLAKAEKLTDQASDLVDRLHERYRDVTADVVGKLRAKFPEWGATVAHYKPIFRAEKIKKEAAERQAKREQNRGRDRGMSR